MRCCPACRLPREPAYLLTGEESGAHVVFAVCKPCAARYERLPRGVAHKAMNGASRRAAGEPARYWSATFGDAGAARLALGLLEHPTTSKDAMQALGWRD